MSKKEEVEDKNSIEEALEHLVSINEDAENEIICIKTKGYRKMTEQELRTYVKSLPPLE